MRGLPVYAQSHNQVYIVKTGCHGDDVIQGLGAQPEKYKGHELDSQSNPLPIQGVIQCISSCTLTTIEMLSWRPGK